MVSSASIWAHHVTVYIIKVEESGIASSVPAIGGKMYLESLVEITRDGNVAASSFISCSG